MLITHSYCQLGAKPFHEPPISSLVSIILFSWSSAIWTLYPDLSQLDPTSTLRSTCSKTREKLSPLTSGPPSLVHMGKFTHICLRTLTPGREGVSAKVKGRHLSHCELEPTRTPIEHCGQRETLPGWFLGLRMCELNRSCALRWLAARKRLKGTLRVSWLSEGQMIVLLCRVFSVWTQIENKAAVWEFAGVHGCVRSCWRKQHHAKKRKKFMWHSRGRSVWEQI